MWIVTLVVFKQNRFYGTLCNLSMNIMKLQLWLKWLRQGCCRVMAFGPLSLTKPFCHGIVLYGHESQLWITFCTYIDANTLRSVPLKMSNFAWNLPRHICTHFTPNKCSMRCILMHGLLFGDGPSIYKEIRIFNFYWLSYIHCIKKKSLESLSLKLYFTWKPVTTDFMWSETVKHENGSE